MKHEPQSGLFEEVLHPIWSKPSEVLDGTEPEHIKKCYWTLWSKMQPFDGRPDSEFVVSWAIHVWSLFATESAHKDPWWLVGQIVKAGVNPRKAAPSQGRAIEGITMALLDAIVEVS